MFFGIFPAISAVAPQQAIIALLFSCLWTDGCLQRLVTAGF